jgi:hypothetical protein
MFPRWEYSLFQSWFRRTLAFQKPLAFLSKIINCFTNIFDSKQLKYSPKVYIFALRLFDAKMATQEEMSRYFWSASTNCPPLLPTCCNLILSPHPLGRSILDEARAKDPGNEVDNAVLRFVFLSIAPWTPEQASCLIFCDELTKNLYRSSLGSWYGWKSLDWKRDGNSKQSHSHGKFETMYSNNRLLYSLSCIHSKLKQSSGTKRRKGRYDLYKIPWAKRFSLLIYQFSNKECNSKLDSDIKLGIANGLRTSASLIYQRNKPRA